MAKDNPEPDPSDSEADVHRISYIAVETNDDQSLFIEHWLGALARVLQDQTAFVFRREGHNLLVFLNGLMLSPMQRT